MGRYPIKREFFPFSRFTPPLGRRFLKLAARFMKVPASVWKEEGITVSTLRIPSYDGEEIPCLLITPEGVGESAPCLIYYHGGGFVLKMAAYHCKNAIRYAREARCRVVMPDYRLAPDHPFPIFFEDCYAAFCWVYDRAEELGIDRARIGVGGDSAGGDLAAGVCMMAKDRHHPGSILLQLLMYPYLDARSCSESFRRYTDTPMWNSTLSKKVTPLTKPDRASPCYLYYSPVEAEDLSGLPGAYIETAEFDCLHDDGILFAQRLREAGIAVELNETVGTMHGFDIVTKAPTSVAAVDRRIEYLRRRFGESVDG